MPQRSQYIFIIVIAVISFLLLRQYEAGVRKPLPEQNNEALSGTLVYSDEQYKLYQDNSRLVLYDKEDSKMSIPAPEANLHLKEKIKDKDTGSAPLLDNAISLGLILSGENIDHIIEIESEFKLLKSYPSIRNDYEHYILIKKSSNQLYYYQKGMLMKEYTVSTGKESHYTPEGTFEIVNKIPYPKGKDPSAPMGSRWMGLAVPYSADKRGNRIDGGPDDRSPVGHKYGIHGTNDESTIGTHASGGCIRMYNKSVAQLYDMIPVGSKVEIIP